MIILRQINGQTFNIQGNVSSSLLPVRFAAVTFINQNDTRQRFSTVTDSLGNYRLSVTTAIDHLDFILPSTVELAQNYPNPFSGTTLISYQLNKSAEVSIKIYNLLGREVRELKATPHIAGAYGLLWDGRDGHGKRVAPGVYFCQLHTGNEIKVKKMLYGIGGTDIKAVTVVPLPITRMKGGSIYEATILYSYHFYS
ncbi:T9SS type A sorting domain-containing protein [bacterium]|nr:T9SS type A sorting domain-containing protein [bacterium]MBU1064012.1 T9SS type A sorting domain-containing protein [bacterium]MBU1634379.1 T9SS type A sorting domain-containing protein [bacterium]